MAKEIGSGAQVEREVGIVVGGGYLVLRGMLGLGAQVVGRPVVGTDDDMGQRCLVGQHAEIL